MKNSRLTKNRHAPSPLSFSFYLYVLFPFWFACFFALAGTAWRPPLASAGLLSFFLLLLIAAEWYIRRFSAIRRLTSPVLNQEHAESKNASIQQQVTRSKTAEGKDRLEGTFLAEFPAGAMTATIHIPFCPAFEKVPSVQVFPLDETDASVRMTPAKTFGIRIDVKRTDVNRNRSAADQIRLAVIAEG